MDYTFIEEIYDALQGESFRGFALSGVENLFDEGKNARFFIRKSMLPSGVWKNGLVSNHMTKI